MMITRGLLTVAVVLATATLGAQTSAPKAQQQKAQPKAAPSRPTATLPYVPAVMQQRMATLSGCLRQKQDYILTDAELSQTGDVAQAAESEGAKAPTTYKLEGISGARLSILVGKRVEVTGSFQGDSKQPGAAGKLPRFEATNVTETSGTCS